jgi:2-oxoglutarate dehydrogenase E2 component (dihydrolipoamide succinyltransferase)
MKLEVKVPELGESDADEVTISFWYFDTGEKVREGEELVELLTDKAAFNVAVPANGVLCEVKVAEGEAASVGDVLGCIETEQ